MALLQRPPIMLGLLNLLTLLHSSGWNKTLDRDIQGLNGKNTLTQICHCKLPVPELLLSGDYYKSFYLTRYGSIQYIFS